MEEEIEMRGGAERQCQRRSGAMTASRPRQAGPAFGRAALMSAWLYCRELLLLLQGKRTHRSESPDEERGLAEDGVVELGGRAIDAHL